MTVPKLIDEINRLFERMVRDPWSAPAPPSPATALGGGETELDVEIPLAGGQLGDVSVALEEGRRLVVRARRRSTARATGAGRAAGTAQEHVERTFTLPEAAEVSAIEARIEGEVLHIRVRLRPDQS